MIEEIKKIKKIELHIHLDGSVPIETLCELSGKSYDEIKNEVVAKDKCENLSEYLTKFDLPIIYMQTKENLKLVSKSVVDYLESQNVVYAEIRFAPMFHTKEGLTYEEVVESVLEGLKENKNVKTNLILCMMRGFPQENNLKTIEVASNYLNKGVCAIDLAGTEDKYPLKDYIELFEIAKSKNIPYIIHAGENGNHKEVELAIELDAKRIGHGIHSIESTDTLNLIKQKDILLEVCPTSNVQTNAIDKYSNHPIKYLYDNKIKLCVNTDNTTVSNITLNEECIKLYNEFNFTIDDFKIMNNFALEKSFANEDEKNMIKDMF